jgi:hypothetical protein
MDDRDLGDLLRELPRVRAGADFDARVLRRIRGGRPAPRWVRALLPALAAAGAIVFAAALRRQETRREAVREETRALARELDEMKRALPSPVVDVGGEDGVRYVIDLRRLPGRRGGVL